MVSERSIHLPTLVFRIQIIKDKNTKDKTDEND